MPTSEVQPDAARINRTTSHLTPADRWDHFLARWGVNRRGHRVEPGLYSLGNPTPDSLVFVTANYTLSFDALRSALDGMDAYILVLNTEGINVWCAAGKGTFGTGELVRRIEVTGLRSTVAHRTLILPQLGAPGVAAHEVRKQSGFSVEYGPIRAADLPAYLQTRRATPEMRTARFDLLDRAVLIPVELVHTLLPMLAGAAILWFAAGRTASLGFVCAVLAGVVLLPVLLPWIPTRDFSTRGFTLGGAVGLPFSLAIALRGRPGPEWWSIAWGAAYLMGSASVTAFLALNFTGSTPFTSRTQVRREIHTYVPMMARSAGAGIMLAAAVAVIRLVEGH